MLRKFIFETVIFVLLLVVAFSLILFRADGYTDPFYVRFTTSKKSNLILGTSRAAQGIQPSILGKYLHKDFFNYSFTIGHSPYGPVYYNSIRKKLDFKKSEGIFILTVDPWSISSATNDPNDSSKFSENNLCVGNTYFVNCNPNYFYLINNFKGKYYKLLNNTERSSFLHEDGWLEINVKMDSVTVAERLEKKVAEYRKDKLPNSKFSSVRFEYLKKIIQLLNTRGKVYLVRLPVHSRMLEIERENMPKFDSIISTIIPMTSGYFDMTKLKNGFEFTDGNHLCKESGKLTSKLIADWISAFEKH